jgi:hypothetical protein
MCRILTYCEVAQEKAGRRARKKGRLIWEDPPRFASHLGHWQSNSLQRLPRQFVDAALASRCKRDNLLRYEFLNERG